MREVEIEEAVDAVLNCGVVGARNFDGHLRVGRALECERRFGGGGVGKEELGCGERVERAGEREGLIEKPACGDKT